LESVAVPNLAQGLEQLKKELLTMGGLVETATRKGVNSLIHRRRDLIDEVIEEDEEIDALENTIDDHAHLILALQRPVANDLRFVLTAMKVNNELERMGDHAKNIAESARFLCEQQPLPVYTRFEQMSEQVLPMVKHALDALVKGDADLAQSVRNDDDLVDQAHQDMFQRLTTLMHDDGSTIERAVQALSASRNLERIADLATNIAKDVIFLTVGEQVRHGGATVVV
jgi:phosphate transport system protein